MHGSLNLKSAAGGDHDVPLPEQDRCFGPVHLIRALDTQTNDVVAPTYLAVLLLLKAAQSLLSLVQPVAKLLPEWMPAAEILFLLLILILRFFIGLGMKTR
jgi:hypothetical protein